MFEINNMNYALLLLAGNSKRFNCKTAKQFYKINGKQLYFYPLISISKSKKINGIILLVPKDKISKIKRSVKNIKKIRAVIAGGETRKETVMIGLNFLEEKMKIKKDDIVLIHDAARPLIDKKIISTAIEQTKLKKATVFAIGVNDTIVQIKENKKIEKYLNREKIFHIQTPQTFQFNIIKEAYKKNNIKNNDDSELVFLNKQNIFLLKGNKKLFKITFKDDLKILKKLM